VLQRYVKTADLDKVYEAVGSVLAGEKPASWELKAYKYFYVVWDELGLAGISIEPTDDLIRYQQKLIDTVAPVSVSTGTAAAFVTTQEEPDINQPTIDYVAHYVPDASDDKFQATRYDRLGPCELPEQDARREVRGVHVLASEGGGLSSRQFRDGAGEAQDVGVGALRPLEPPIEIASTLFAAKLNQVYRTKIAGPSTTSKRSVCSVGNRNLRK
jgi:hypothetical protein